MSLVAFQLAIIAFDLTLPIHIFAFMAIIFILQSRSFWRQYFDTVSNVSAVAYIGRFQGSVVQSPTLLAAHQTCCFVQSLTCDFFSFAIIRNSLWRWQSKHKLRWAFLGVEDRYAPGVRNATRAARVRHKTAYSNGSCSRQLLQSHDSLPTGCTCWQPGGRIREQQGGMPAITSLS